jgi:hypothetical protein
MLSQIVAIHRHVKCANRNADAFHVVHHGREPMRQWHSPGGDPHQHQTLCASIRFQDLMSYSRASSGNLFGIHDHSGGLRTELDAGLAIVALGLWRAGT